MLNNHTILHSLLNDLKLTQLNKLSSLLGAVKAGNTKSQKCGYINSYLSQLTPYLSGSGTIDIFSIDTGIINFSWAQLTLHTLNGRITLVNWNKLNLNDRFNLLDATTNPKNMSSLTSQLTSFILSQSPRDNPLYTIERQRLRTNSSKFITEPILNVNILEHLLFHSLTNANRFVMSSDPARITKFWLANQKQYNAKESKKLRIQIVNTLLSSQSNVFQLSPSLNDKLSSTASDHPGSKNKRKNHLIFDRLQLNESQNGKRKDDDLADSLLHGLSWSFWLRNYQHLHNEILKDGGNLKLDQWVEYHWDQHIKLLDSIGSKN